MLVKDEFSTSIRAVPDVSLSSDTAACAPVSAHDIALIVHELRNPLIAMIGFGRLMAETADPGERAEMGRMSAATGGHMLSLINDLLDLAKSGTTPQDLRLIPVNALRLATDCLSVVESSAAEKGLRLAFDLAYGFPLEFVGDPQRLRQILINLLSNAVKFTESGQVALRLKVDLVCATMCFSVEDEGPGMTPEQLQHLFQPYGQVAPAGSVAAAQLGTGLGLMISQNLARSMGGKITVQSTVGQGSIFTFCLPFCARRAENKAPDALAAITEASLPVSTVVVPQDTVPSLPPQTCLVVDDNDIVREMIATILTRSGHKVDTAASGTQALACAVQKAYDLILIDKQMTDMSGFDTARQLRHLTRLVPAPKLVGLSALVTVEDELAASAAGMDAIFAKTASPRDLIRTITDLVTRSRGD